MFGFEAADLFRHFQNNKVFSHEPGGKLKISEIKLLQRCEPAERH